MKFRVLSACLTAVITIGSATAFAHTPRRSEAPALRSSEAPALRLSEAPALRRSEAAAVNDRREEAKAQVEFGIQVAQKKLWREATYRFEKATEVDPTYAAAWNNLGIAYEEQGNFKDANNAYEKAIKLDPGNVLIRQNYDLFKEIYDRIQARNRR
jgi:Flp pilus assembly protein TadD